MLNFAFSNWRWLVPSAFAVAFGLYAGAQHMEVLTLEKNAAAGQAAAEKAVDDARAADVLKTARLEADHAAEVKSLQEKANAQQVAIASAAHSDTCLHTGAARAFLGGLPPADGVHAPGNARPARPRSAAGTDPGLPR